MNRNNADPHRYDDMLDLPRPISKKHPPMSPVKRAAQFSPFAALTGFEDQISSAQVFRCNRICLSEEEQVGLNRILSALKKHDTVTITCFQEEPGTDGSGGRADGFYRTLSGEIERLDLTFQTLRLQTESGFVDISFPDILVLQPVI